MKKILCFVAVASIAALMGCTTSEKQASEENAMVSEQQATKIEVPFRQAERYFVKNDVDSIPQTPITTKEDFDGLFGAAPVMGEGGMPTQIDFDKEYVIAVSLPEINKAVNIVPVSLEQNTEDQTITFSYKTETIDETPLSYTMVPCLIIVVSNDYKGEVSYVQINKNNTATE